MTLKDAIINAFLDLGGERTAVEIRNWITRKYGDQWKDYSTQMADMVLKSEGGNNSSTVPREFQVLRRVSNGVYKLLE